MSENMVAGFPNGYYEFGIDGTCWAVVNGRAYPFVNLAEARAGATMILHGNDPYNSTFAEAILEGKLEWYTPLEKENPVE